MCFLDLRETKSECHSPAHRTGISSVLSDMHPLSLSSQNPGFCQHHRQPSREGPRMGLDQSIRAYMIASWALAS